MAKKQLSPIDTQLCELIQEAYRRPFSVQSDVARKNAAVVAMSASIGLLSTKVTYNLFSSDWRVTVKGLTYLEETAGIHLEDEGFDEGHEG